METRMNDIIRYVVNKVKMADTFFGFNPDAYVVCATTALCVVSAFWSWQAYRMLVALIFAR